MERLALTYLPFLFVPERPFFLPLFPFELLPLRIENRVTGNCRAVYDYSRNHYLFRLIRMFDPGRVEELQTTGNDIDMLADVMPALLPPKSQMKANLPTYITLARDFNTNRSSINDLTRDVLGWWRRHGAELGPEWCKGARIVFSLMPNSAASERVFSLLACLFPSTRASTLADQLELTLILRFNQRVA